MEKKSEAVGMGETLDVTLETIEDKDNGGLLHVSVIPPKEGKRKPCAIICALDISGSMDDPSVTEGAKETDCFSILDLVKHAVNTVVNTLNEDDYVALVTFESNAKVLMNFERMTEAGKKKAASLSANMSAGGGTNIWNALRVCIETINKSSEVKDINTSLWLFTDGQSDDAEGIVPALTKYLGGKNPPCVINTFGFGYNLDSKLLYGISALGNGIFCYLPDCNLVGTTFVNCLCNTLATYAFKASIQIKAKNASGVSCIGYKMAENCIELGSVQYGQPRDFVIGFKPTSKDVKFDVLFKYQAGKIDKSIVGYQTTNPISIYREYCRSKFNELVVSCLDSYVSGSGDPKYLKTLEEIIASSPSKDDEYTKALLRDVASPNELEGRVTKAVSTPERVKRWGSHYIRSILRAHKLQQCHNFKDPGVQVYGGKLFKELQKKADLIFCSLPPPTPSIKRAPTVQVAVVSSSSAPATSASAPASAPVDMQAYNDCSGGCFDGEGLVQLTNGTLKKVKDLKKGDEIIASDGVCTKVICLIAFPVKRKIQLVELNGLRMTPKHPVRQHGVWKYPKDLGKVETVYCDCIYNLVLDKHHVVTVNDIDLVTLGHEKHENSVVEHPYYGTERIIADLKSMTGWTEGTVVMEKCRKYKDPFNGLVMAIH